LSAFTWANCERPSGGARQGKGGGEKHGKTYALRQRLFNDSLGEQPQPAVVALQYLSSCLPPFAGHCLICGLERRTGRSGKDSIDHAPNGHDDLANAVAGAAAATSSKYTYNTSLDWIAGPDADAA